VGANEKAEATYHPGTTAVNKWADEAMFASEKHDASSGPKVHLLAMNSDPLGQIAACAKMYKGEVVRALDDVTDEERRLYLSEMQKTKLAMPLESVQLHFMLENVTRAFTHQLVRQRTAAYAQESMRFAVVEDMNQAVALPPSLAWANEPHPPPEWWDGEHFTVGDAIIEKHGHHQPWTPEFDLLPRDVRRFLKWRYAVATTSRVYNDLVEDGMPAEDARGLMPTNIITRVNYITNLRGLLDHAGNRLCTQAQFEWRSVFALIAKAIREYQQPRIDGDERYGDAWSQEMWYDQQGWQYEAISELLKPVCYQTGKCAFEANFDRKCSIRDRVQENASQGRPSEKWDQDYDDGRVFIGAIHTREWLTDPGAAR